MQGVSVLMAVRNGVDTLPMQLHALSGQLPDAAEVIFVDDRSTDQSPTMLTEFVERWAYARLVFNDREPGKANCINLAAQLSVSDVLVVLDQDDAIAPGYLLALAEGTRRHGFAFGRMEYRKLNDSDHAASLWDHPDQDRARVRFRGQDGSSKEVRVGSGCCIALRRDVFDRLGGFALDVGAADDIDLCLRAAKLGYGYTQIPQAVVSYRFRRGYWALFRQRLWYGSSWSALERKYQTSGIVMKPTPRIMRDIGLAASKYLSFTRSRRLQGSAELGFSIGQLSGRVRHGMRDWHHRW